MKAAPVAIELCNASFGWHGHTALRGISGRFEPGAMTAVVGPNGAGKSTLIKGIMGVLRPMAGSVTIGGAGRSELAWLPQAAELDRAFPAKVLDLVALGAWRRVGSWRRYGREEIDRCMHALETVGLADMAGRGIDTLSGGQMQRTLFARMLVQDAPVLMLDEPFTAVDSHTADELMALLCDLHGQGRSVIAVLHDLDLVRDHFPQCLLLSGSVVAWGETGMALSETHLRTARQWHTRAFA
ncbi:ABC transporter ATP-binding protein [Achromobacter xylosoxidans]|uniref:Manganese import ATP-binding protein ScaC n=2 Tax=Achromobacter ruhlandii TaxID=72557 RepID=A0ABM8LSG3_9BURK|nr:ABC transporter ATP-binding protein [Achromobacter ruhlandii]AKP92585.1 Zinc ABC transporter, ATP-binding protein ZnuC [Achromobacter xylosoxidans]AMG44400.1 ABC transporter ATP-binding protein [Achromobacter xylosoxidans]AOU96429.1 zinc ABC transporter ATP-binding protein ZnuC [Achromobacter ruhlandii]MCZ8432151.1 ABC transporter ATP-binding protein [Achromobacter ruhlandii]MDC6088779.1 ABC transporter ATP-binding protein [Achromobacter ruhlandii]